MTKLRPALFPLTLLLIGCGHQTIKPFTSDGCSSFPDGTAAQNKLWISCCTVHDYAYWKGGRYLEREEADNALKTCVEATGESTLSLLMLAGVRVGGTPLLPTTFRWGYGWPYLRWYGELSTQDTEQLKQAAPIAPLNKD